MYQIRMWSVHPPGSNSPSSPLSLFPEESTENHKQTTIHSRNQLQTCKHTADDETFSYGYLKWAYYTVLTVLMISERNSQIAFQAGIELDTIHKLRGTFQMSTDLQIFRFFQGFPSTINSFKVETWLFFEHPCCFEEGKYRQTWSVLFIYFISVLGSNQEYFTDDSGQHYGGRKPSRAWEKATTIQPTWNARSSTVL